MHVGGLPIRIHLPAGLATAIGSLPQLSAPDASRFVRDWLPRLPAAPTLPAFVDAAHMLDDSQADADAFDGLRDFLTSLRGRVGPVVLSLTGPVTIDLTLLQQGVEHSAAAAMSIAAVEQRARRVLDMARCILPGAPVLLFLEEPGLANSMHPTFPLASGEIEELVSGVVDPICSEAVVGVQVNGRADWAMLLRTGIGILGAPVSARLETAALELGRFLESGGFIAWGAVPVDEPLGANAERLWRRLSALWAELATLGLDPMTLREHSIITPAAGLGSFGISQAERVMKLTIDLSERVLNQVIGARLSIGA